MHSRRRSWWATSLAVGPIVLAACAAELYQSGEGGPGAVAATPGRASGVLAAPHRTSDARTRDIVAELHGNTHRDATSRIEIATVGVDRDEAIQLRALFELIRDAHLRGNREVPSLAVLVEPGDTIRYAASGAKRDGILRLARRALHIELPRGARTEW